VFAVAVAVVVRVAIGGVGWYSVGGWVGWSAEWVVGVGAEAG
jgi:hypothetical protein